MRSSDWRSDLCSSDLRCTVSYQLAQSREDGCEGHEATRRFQSKSRISYAGWGGRIRTGACRYQKPVPYRLATPQHVRPSRIEEASLYSSRACGKGLFCSFPAENISWIDRSPDRYNLSAIAGSGHRLRNSRGQPTAQG